MLSGVKFIAREEVEKGRSDSRKIHSKGKDGDKRRKKKSYGSSDDELQKIKKSSRRSKKWSSSEEDSSLDESEPNDDHRVDSLKETEVMRKEIGMEWMLKPGASDALPKKDVEKDISSTVEIKRVNNKELNPYLEGDGSGYPEEAADGKPTRDKLVASSLVGDGGASWRLKALKRAQEQATREGRSLKEVVGERWDCLGELSVAVSSHTAAPSRAHLHAIRNRKKGLFEDHQTNEENEKAVDKNISRHYLKDVSVRNPKMRPPKVDGSLSWRKQKPPVASTEDAALINAAISSVNMFSNDGSFMAEVLGQQSKDLGGSGCTSLDAEGKLGPEVPSIEKKKPDEDSGIVKAALSSNQLAAKALQLRMKGKHEEADKLLQEAEGVKMRQSIRDDVQQKPQNINKYIVTDLSKRKEEDADRHLAQKIMQNKKYSISGRADDEYDYEDGPTRKSRKKGGDDNGIKDSGKNKFVKRILTQQERCTLCFENPTRPKHLVVSIANFSYLMLPIYQPVVPGHCCILTLQHESATRTIDENVWDEFRNFKKCLIMMFAKQDMDLVFIETVMGLAQQRRHCMIECIPLPREIARQAPLYFKKAIDEAEDEWSQHDAKKLIDTSVKGLRGSIPKNFPYFHVEFGLNQGFVHVIDDETNFKSNIGLNVIRGMLQLPEEDMYRRRQNEATEAQKQAVAKFAKEWEPFDWTKQLV